MTKEIQTQLDNYIVWLKDSTQIREVNEWTEITTPYLDRHNDSIQIYARKEKNGFVLTDDGYTINDLELSGCNLKTDKRQALLRTILNGFGIKLNDDRLETSASSRTFALQKHNLVQAILAVNDMFYLASPVVTSIFLEDVANWFDLNEIRYIPTVKFTGKSGYDHVFDFVIPKSRRYPERIVRALNRPERDTAEAFMHAWFDTKDVRAPDSEAFALLNDTEVRPSSSVVDALRNYEITTVLWSERNSALEKLAA